MKNDGTKTDDHDGDRVAPRPGNPRDASREMRDGDDREDTQETLGQDLRQELQIPYRKESCPYGEDHETV